MNKAELLKKQEAATNRFDKLQKQEKEIQEELLRLQGDYRTYGQMIEEIEANEEKPGVEVKDESKEKK